MSEDELLKKTTETYLRETTDQTPVYKNYHILEKCIFLTSISVVRLDGQASFIWGGSVSAAAAATVVAHGRGTRSRGHQFLQLSTVLPMNIFRLILDSWII